MTQAPSAIFKIPTNSPQPSRGKPARPARSANAGRPAPGRVLANGTGRAATPGGGDVIELEHGITVYPAREDPGRWRAVWYEDGVRQQCEAASEAKLAVKLEKVSERLAADAPNMRRLGGDLIGHYLDPDRLAADARWSRKHADTQRRLCERFAVPVISLLACEDIKISGPGSRPGRRRGRGRSADDSSIAAVADQERVPGLDHAQVASWWMTAGLTAGLAPKWKSSIRLSRGDPAAWMRRWARRRSRSSHSAITSSARKSR